MSGKFLFDTSSMLYALKLKKLRVIYGNYIQWLTVYEVTNALWK
ncbi:MAG: VapC toxin family PIN domain ribonuclease, partial [Thermoprotei archaeon]